MCQKIVRGNRYAQKALYESLDRHVFGTSLVKGNRMENIQGILKLDKEKLISSVESSRLFTVMCVDAL